MALIILVATSILFAGWLPVDMSLEGSPLEGDPICPDNDRPQCPSRAGYANPVYEFRSMWMDGYEIVNISEIEKAVEFARNYNFNCMSPLINANYYGVYYNSRYEKKHKDVTPDFDPLMELVKEAHKYGIEVHPWYHTMINRQGIRNHPEWGVVSSSGARSTAWVNPAIPEAREYIADVIVEVMSEYPLDGIKLDTVRYPNSDYSYDDYSLQKFEDSGMTDFNDFRRLQITETMEVIYNAVVGKRPYKWVGADVSHSYNGGWYYSGAQDSAEWDRRGKIDYLNLMSYTTSLSYFESGLRNHLDNSHGARIVAGPRAYVNYANGEYYRDILVSQVYKAQELGAMGVCIFNYRDMVKNLTFPQALLDGPFSTPTACPIKNMTLPTTTTK